jgi:hypothetical protein
MSVTPYGKDATPDLIHMTLMRISGVRFGSLDCSTWTGFEALIESHRPLGRRHGPASRAWLSGGVLETKFVRTWWRFRMRLGRKRRFVMVENFLAERDKRPLDDDW